MAFFKKEKAAAAKAAVGKAALSLTKEQLAKVVELAGGKHFETSDDLVGWLARTQTVRFNDTVQAELTTDDLWQLQQQALGMGIPYDQYVKEFVEDSICLQLNGGLKYGRF